MNVFKGSSQDRGWKGLRVGAVAVERGCVDGRQGEVEGERRPQGRRPQGQGQADGTHGQRSRSQELQNGAGTNSD